MSAAGQAARGVRTGGSSSGHVVCRLDELIPGRPHIVTIRSRQVGVVLSGDRVYAIRNVCPHHGAELCKGTVSGTMMPSDAHEYVLGMEGQVLRCPWHGWEFDMQTGRSLFDPEHYRVKTYPVSVRDGDVIVNI